jgi:hypothetical protein
MNDERLLSTVKHVTEYLGEPLPYKNQANLLAHLVGLESVRLELAEARIEWLKLLHTGEQKVLHPKDPHLTELDRKTSLQSMTADLRAEYELLLSLEKLTEDRLSFGRQLLG